MAALTATGGPVDAHERVRGNGHVHGNQRRRILSRKRGQDRVTSQTGCVNAPDEGAINDLPRSERKWPAVDCRLDRGLVTTCWAASVVLDEGR
jgi:hypothetical protein